MSYKDWKVGKLSDIADVIMGQSPKGETCFDEKCGIPLLNGPTEFGSFCPKAVQWTNDARKVCNPGDLLFCVRGSTTGRMNWADDYYAIGRGLAAIHHKNGLKYNRYIRAILETNLETLLSSATGSTFPNVGKDLLNNIEIQIPELSEQGNISSILLAFDEKIQINNKINNNLEQIAQEIFKSWFVNFEPFKDGEFIDSELGPIPKGWRVVTLDNCVEFRNGYAFKSTKLLKEEQVDCYSVFKMGHIKVGGGFNSGSTKSWIKKEDCKKLDKYLLQTGDLLMCMTDMKGKVALLGHTALMDVSNKYILNQRVGLIRCSNKFGIDYPFLYILTNYEDFIENLRSRANSGVQVNLSTREIKATKFVIANEIVNKQFDKIVKPMFENMFNIRKENERLKIIRDTLLPKLMSGEIDVSEVII